MKKLFGRCARVLALGTPLITTACELSPSQACFVYGTFNRIVEMNDDAFMAGCAYGAAAAYDRKREKDVPLVNIPQENSHDPEPIHGW